MDHAGQFQLQHVMAGGKKGEKKKVESPQLTPHTINIICCKQNFGHFTPEVVCAFAGKK